MNACSAPWYELNLSAPDSNVSACCYYGGFRDYWKDEPTDINHYWNGPALQEVRRVQKRLTASPNGCSSCFYFQQSVDGKGWTGDNYYDFTALPNGLSQAQADNWRLAKADYEARSERVRCTPLKLYANFGYACNISCTMCHQVPRRQELKRQILADTVLAWHEMLERCLQVFIVGGEPFAIPEAVKFIRKFAPDVRYDPVQLVLLTNGTVLHKHWKTLKDKRLLWLGVSLDSIGEGYERIRVGGRWADVERNILDALDVKAKSHPDWKVTTSANIQKSGIPFLPEFAKWHVKHDLHTFFFDFISAPGVEDTYHTDNVLQNPQLLDGIPGWQDSFLEAAAVFRSAGWEFEASLLDQYRERTSKNQEVSADRISSMRRQGSRNDWQPVTTPDGRNLRDDLKPYHPENKPPVEVFKLGDLTGFARTRLGDFFATTSLPVQVPEEGGKFRLRAHWPKGVPSDRYTRLAHVVVQDQTHTTLSDFREYHDFGFGTDLSITGDVPRGVTAIRVVLTPLGEDTTLLPESIELDVDPETTVGVQAVRDNKPTSRAARASAWARRNIRRLTRLGSE